VTKLNLVLEEWLTNVISYGFDAGGDHRIVLDLALDESGELSARVEDDGRPFDPLSLPTPDVTVGLDERKVGGLGVLLIRRLMDDVTYSRSGDRNVLVMRKRVASS
jgi:serine/threonine-protein kinase RsbW